jgi:hypothetical protein
MKLRKIYESVLTEIGDSSHVPAGATFSVMQIGGNVNFDFLGNQYNVLIRILVKQEDKIALVIDFDADGETDMTNKNQPIKVMGFVVGCISEWLSKYKEKFGETNLIYIKYNPTAESDETKVIGNKRDQLYRMFIEKFAKRYGSAVNFSTAGGIIAQFKPPIEIT